jgi:hypothetical protein
MFMQNVIYNIYEELHDSVSTCEKCLLYQFGASENVSDFLHKLYNIRDKKLKKNIIEVIGVPTSGKNWFFDSILTFCISHGQSEDNIKMDNTATLRMAGPFKPFSHLTSRQTTSVFFYSCISKKAHAQHDGRVGRGRF